MSGSPKALAARRFSWRKLSSAKWSDSWLERLAYLGPTRAMVIEFPGARSVRVEAHGLTEKEARGAGENVRRQGHAGDVAHRGRSARSARPFACAGGCSWSRPSAS